MTSTSEDQDLAEGMTATFTIGEIRARVISDGRAAWPAWPTYAPNASKTDVADALGRHGLDRELYNLAFGALYLETPRARVLMDTGAGDELGPGLGQVAQRLRSAGIEPSSIDTIVLTHGHPDHIGGLVDRDGALVYPNAEVIMSEA